MGSTCLLISLLPNLLEAKKFYPKQSQRQLNLETINTSRRERRGAESGAGSGGGGGRIIRIIIAPPASHQVAQKRGWLRLLRAYLPHHPSPAKSSPLRIIPDIGDVGEAYRRILKRLQRRMKTSIEGRQDETFNLLQAALLARKKYSRF